MAAAASLETLHDPARAAALLDPMRRRLLVELREPDSASGLARRLELPRQVLNYHLRELEKHRLVELVEERRKGNCIERVVRATARSYVITPEAMGELAADPAAVADRFSSAYLVATAAGIISDVAVLREKAAAAGKSLATLAVEGEVRFASATARAEFADQLGAAFARLIAKYHDETGPGGRTFRFVIAGYPKRRKA